MDDMFGADYYTVGLPTIFVGLIALYIGATILWNRKWVPMRRGKGVATPYFGNSFARVTRFAFREDPRNLLPKSQNKFVKKFLSIKSINWALLIATFAMIGLHMADAWIPALILLLVVWIQTAKPLSQRDRILQRMFAVASAGFRYGRGSELNPWGFVRIKKWEDLTTPGETHISIPANWDSSSIAARDGFESHFNTTVTDNNSWIYEWKSADGTVIAQPISHLPERAMYPGVGKHPWYEIPLGLGTQGEVSVDLTKTPHMLICGSTGSGKSVLQRNLVFHCIQHNDMWRFLGVDVKRVELTPFKRYKKTVLGIGANLEDGVEIVRYAKEVMETRYEEMEAKGVNHFSNLLDENGKPPYAIMLMVDEAFMFLSLEGAKTDEGKMRDQLHGEAAVMLGEIARLGRASGVHLVLATQRPDATVIKGELKANLDIRIAAGRLDATPSSMVLDSGAATQLPGHIKGRGIVRFGGDQHQFQGYFAEQDWIEEFLQANPHREPELYPTGNTSSEDMDLDDELEELAASYNFEDGKIDIAGETVTESLDEEELARQEAIVEAPLGAPGEIPEELEPENFNSEADLSEDDKKLLQELGLDDSTTMLPPVKEDMSKSEAELYLEQFYANQEPIDIDIPPTIQSVPEKFVVPEPEEEEEVAVSQSVEEPKPVVGLPSKPGLDSLPPLPPLPPLPAMRTMPKNGNANVTLPSLPKLPSKP
jgi:hypothetical protein